MPRGGRDFTAAGGLGALLGRLVVTALPVTALLAVTAPSAMAHEPRVAAGFQFVVGWGDEPTYTGFKNSVQVSVSEANGGPPVTDLGDSLRVEVIKGSDRVTLPLVANFRVGAFGTPGDYRAWLTPTRPGSYTFRLTGTIRGRSVDESFTSSGTTFNDVEDAATLQFPARDPSAGQVATRIDREIPRLEARLRAAQDRADSARTLAVLGAAVGAGGLLAAVAALVAAGRWRSRRDGAARPGESRSPEEQAGSLSR